MGQIIFKLILFLKRYGYFINSNHVHIKTLPININCMSLSITIVIFYTYVLCVLYYTRD